MHSRHIWNNNYWFGPFQFSHILPLVRICLVPASLRKSVSVLKVSKVLTSMEPPDSGRTFSANPGSVAGMEACKLSGWNGFLPGSLERSGNGGLFSRNWTAKRVSKGRGRVSCRGEFCWEKLAKGVSHIQLKYKTESKLIYQIYSKILGKLTAIDNFDVF